MEYCKTAARDLVYSQQSRDPFELAMALGVKTEFRDLGTLKGMFIVINDTPFIIINQDLDEVTAKIVCAHELGHYVLHRSSITKSGIQEFSLFNMESKMEKEANTFAAEILLSEEEILQNAKDCEDLFSLASLLNTHPSLLSIKLGSIHQFNGIDLSKNFL